MIGISFGTETEIYWGDRVKVLRNGSLIGWAEVVWMAPGSSVCAMDPSSSKGSSIPRVGDSVLFEGAK